MEKKDSSVNISQEGPRRGGTQRRKEDPQRGDVPSNL